MDRVGQLNRHTDREAGFVTVAAAPSAYHQLLAHRLLGGDQAQAQLAFDPAVLHVYRERGFKIYRTDSAGKLQQPGGWYIDFGITAGDSVIHTSLSNLAKLPEGERGQWASHVLWPEMSTPFLKMQIGGASCNDDGEVRAW